MLMNFKFIKTIKFSNNTDNFYLFTSLIFIFFYLFNRLYYSQWDTLSLYILSLKPLINEKIYIDYNFQHAPYLNFFFELLNLFNINSFYFLLILGIFQSLFAGYLSVLFAKQIIKSSFLNKICFLVTIFFIGNEYFYFFWDCYVPLIGIYGLYLVFFEKRNILGAFLLSITWFLKQTFGITFFLIFIFLSLANFIHSKKKYYYVNIFIFFLFLIFHLTVIYLFSDLNEFYNKNFLFTFRFASTYEKNSIFDYLFGIFFLLPDINSFTRLKYNLFETFSLNQISFYFLFRLPVFILNIFLLLRIKHFFKKYYKAFLILSLSCILPLPLLGRGYWGVIYFLPVLTLTFFFYLIKNRIFFFNISYKKKIVFIYLFIIFTYLLAINLKKINFNFDRSNNVIHSKSNFFLNLNSADFIKSDFEGIRDMYRFIEKNKLENIFVVDTKSIAIMVLLPQVPVNRFYLGVSSGDHYFNWNAKFLDTKSTNLEVIVNDFKIKSPNYVLYNKTDYLVFKNFLPKELLKEYSVKYSNNNFTLLKLNN